jgi:membrane-associated protein
VFRKEYIDKAEVFYAKYGNKAMLLAHFVPIIRAFAPVTAGAAKMNRVKFFIYDAIGDIVWAAGITLLGWWLGSRVPGVEKYVEPVMIGVIVLAFVPTLYHLWRDPKFRALLHRKRTQKTKQSPDDNV